MEIVHAMVRGRAVGKGLVYASTSLAAYPTAGRKPKRCSLRHASSASHGEGHPARTSTTDDASTHPPSRTLENRVFPCSRESSRLGHSHGRSGEQRALRMLETSHRDGTRDAPQEGDLYRNGVPRVIVRVTSHQGGWESHPQGKGAQVVRRSAAMRNARCGEPQWRSASLAAFGRQE